MPSSSSNPTYKLYAPEASFRAFATLIAAEYNGVDIEVSTDVTEAVSKSPVGKLPLLVLPNNNNNNSNNNNDTEQVIFSSHAMARFVASLRRDTGLQGTTLGQAAEIDAWMDFAAQDLELPACVWFYPVAGYMPFSAVAYEKAKTDFAKGLTHLEKHLQNKTFLVGDQITLADIVVVSTILYPLKLVADPDYMKPFAKVGQWFLHCVQQAEFQQVIGHVTLCQKELKANGSA